MEEMGDSKDPDNCEEDVTFWGQRLMGKDPRMLQAHRPMTMTGCLTRASLPLLLLLVSLGLFFVLLVTIQVQVFRIHHYLQSENRDPQALRNHCNHEILQQLTRMNSSLADLCRPCPWNWEYFQRNCYFISWTTGPWHRSASACQGQGAQLVIVNSAEEQGFLQSLRRKKDTSQAWIGLSDHHNEGAWHWVDGTKLQQSFWNEGEPNNVGDEDCVELTKSGWNDNKCTAENFWICKKPSTPCSGL